MNILLMKRVSVLFISTISVKKKITKNKNGTKFIKNYSCNIMMSFTCTLPKTTHVYKVDQRSQLLRHTNCDGYCCVDQIFLLQIFLCQKNLYCTGPLDHFK